jgi:hypothetical protein
MCNAHTIQVLSQTESGCIYLCTGCGTYNVIFKNILLFLIEEEVNNLKNIFQRKIGVSELDMPIWNKMDILMETPFPNTFFCFDKADYKEFTLLLSEAVAAIETKLLLQNISMN